jgi:hypothetical protein
MTTSPELREWMRNTPPAPQRKSRDYNSIYNASRAADGEDATQLISIKVPRAWCRWLADLEHYPSRSEAIRTAIRDFILRETKMMQEVEQP